MEQVPVHRISPVIERVPLSGGGYSFITTLLGFNETNIECVAVFYEGSTPFQFTSPVTLLIQG